MENLLEFDLNELVSKQVMDKISSLEKEIQSLRESNVRKNNEISELKTRINDSLIFENFLNKIREKYYSITSTKETKDSWEKSKARNQFDFIENVMLNLFGIEKERGGWYCHGNDGRLDIHLAINYYNNKETIIELLNLLKKDKPDFFEKDPCNFISVFKMPYDYPKDEILRYVRKPEYNTNGCIFGISEYWVSYGAGKANMPHDLIMQSLRILEDDVFSELLNSIKKRVPNYYYLFAVAKHNKSICLHQREMLGECLLDINDTKVLTYDVVKDFIKENIKYFNEKTLNYIYTMIQEKNQYSMLHWSSFPIEYQKLFLKSKRSIDEILKTLMSYECKWTTEEKEEFLKEYLKDKD